MYSKACELIENGGGYYVVSTVLEGEKQHTLI
jgi:hypothetical protein